MIILLFLSFFPWTMNLSTADLRKYWTEFHETWWSYRYMFLVGPKVFSFVVKGGDIIIYPHIKFWWYRTMLNFYGHFLYRILAAILKMADISKFWKRRIAPLMVTYHYVKFYVSIIKNSKFSDFIKIWYVGR
jgi:hypothetical protein